MDAVNNWMSNNFLKLNEDKTEIPEVTCMGITIDSELNFNSHLKKVTKTSLYHLRNIAKIELFLCHADAEKLIHAFISNRLDYCNAVFTRLPKQSQGKLQFIQNGSSRLLTKTRRN